MRVREKVLWCVSQCVVTVLMFQTLVVWISWLQVEPIADAPAIAVAKLPANCPAFNEIYKGKYHEPTGVYVCKWIGTVQSNPQGFMFCTGKLFLFIAFLGFTGVTGRGFWLTRRSSGTLK
jgi:hypothetical protein